MLLTLDFKVEFATTGKIFKGSHDFQTGLSAITGRNEAGKSLRLEMIRYALFGSKALRSEAKNYKSISSTVDFVVGGETYKVHRGGKNIFLAKGDDHIATGTNPVNAAIIRLLGYDLEVFDIANACMQGEIEALSHKKPTERKRMVDRTIGLDALDNVLEEVNADITNTRNAIKLLNEKVIQRYEEPIKPEGLTDETLEQMEGVIDVLEKGLLERTKITGMLNGAYVPKPVEPKLMTTETETLESLQSKLTQLMVDNASLPSMKEELKRYEQARSKVQGDAENIKKFLSGQYQVRWVDFERYKQSQVEEPNFTQEHIDCVRNGNKASQQRSKARFISCPACEHKFDINNIQVEDYDLEGYKQAVQILGGLSEDLLREREEQLRLWEKFKSMTPIIEPDLSIKFNRPELLPYIEYLEEKDKQGYLYEREKLKLAGIELRFDEDKHMLEERISSLKHYESVMGEYNRQVELRKKYLLLENEHKFRLDQLKYVDVQLAQAKETYQKLRRYEDDVKIYKAKMQAQSEALESIKELEGNIASLLKVRKSLQELKPKVKMYLLPSLNRVASQLLSQMTNGERSRIEIDEEFNIDVDGQPVNTLSGSGKAVANLAVRIGLGMVLTNKVFSVLLADEIDAAMDDERAKYTAECLRNLTGTINQIILVSHKDLEVDHKIQV